MTRAGEGDTQPDMRLSHTPAGPACPRGQMRASSTLAASDATEDHNVMKLERDNVKAGLFVLTGLGLFVLFVLLLADFQALFERQQRVSVYYQLADGLGGLRIGDEVTLGDEAVGRVTAIRDVTDPDRPGRVVGKLVRFTMPARYELNWDARIEVVTPPIGTGARLNIASVGTGEPYDRDQRIPDEMLQAVVEIDEMAPVIGAHIPQGAIPGGIAPSQVTQDFARELGIQDVQRRQIQTLLANLSDASDDAPLISAELRESLPAVTERLTALLDEARELFPEAQQTIEHLRLAAEEAQQIVSRLDDRSEGWFDGVDAIVADARQISDRTRSLLEETDPQLRRTVDNLAELSQSFRDETMVKVDETLEAARDGARSFDEAAEQIGRLITSQGPVIERTMANLQLTSDQLKLTAIEVRRSPWRLLYEPEARELETDNVYDAARSFALAAGALQSASESLRAFTTARPDDEASIERKLEHLDELFERFREAETRFWDEVDRLGR